MRIFVCYGADTWEGCSTPLVCSSLDAAKEQCPAGDERTIDEYVTDDGLNRLVKCGSHTSRMTSYTKPFGRTHTDWVFTPK